MSLTEVNIEKLKELARSSNQEPFVMLNLLKFKKNKGRENYKKYLAGTSRISLKLGISAQYLGAPNEKLTESVEWDLIMMVHYPSRKTFIEFIDHPDYIKVQEFREIAIERAVLYATDPLDFGEFIKS